MTKYAPILTVDLGIVSCDDSKESFRVRLDARPLMTLIADAERAYRIYEFMLISRAGDVWDYVNVTPEAIPRRVAERIARVRERPAPYFDLRSWPNGLVPFNDFDRLFFIAEEETVPEDQGWLGHASSRAMFIREFLDPARLAYSRQKDFIPYWTNDGTLPEDRAWLEHRTSEVMCAYANQLLSIVVQAKGQLGVRDHLIAHELRRIRAGTHVFDQLERQTAIARSQRDCPQETRPHTREFYDKLGELLQDPEIVSVAYEGIGDYEVLRKLASEQRGRATATGHEPRIALGIEILGGDAAHINEAWDFRFGVCGGSMYGDLFIDEEGTRLGIMNRAAIAPEREPRRYILTRNYAGEMDGYSAESGDGWALYRGKRLSRRSALRWHSNAYRAARSPVLKLETEEAWVYSFDFGLIVVGESVDHEARTTLAETIVAWQAAGQTPVVIVLGDTTPFDKAGCHSVILPPSDDARATPSGQTPAKWLGHFLYDRCPWLDVVFALNVPPWVEHPLAFHVRQQERPWPSWVAATPGLDKLKVDFELQGDLATLLANARSHARAQGKRQ